ncbi:MAG: polysaccharide pyruvyl transferase family protein [Alphaproteobacteria bacterium]|nr:polysaccharide pyruvyl transferase family protein [Alphaproteobacteria bacterium]
MAMPLVDDRLSADVLVQSLRQRLSDCFAKAIPDGPLALVDFPDYSNVGDSAIWLGQMVWLDEMGRTPVYHAAYRDFSTEDLRHAAPDGPILINGGGNFGTIWPRHEALRLQLLHRFPGRPIVQLPQSIHYADETRADEMARAISAHGAFTLLVRDARSFEFAQRHFDCTVQLCPDAALYLGCQPRASARTDVFALMRTDDEKVMQDDTALPEDIVEDDWIHEGRGERNILRARVKIDSLLAASRSAKRLRRFRLLARWRLQRGLSMLSQGRVVVTDRLHAHILSLLLDIPHVALDNNYGKLSGFARQWTADYRGFHQAQTREEAFQIARTLL